MFCQCYEAEETKGFLITHFFKRILIDQIDRELTDLKNIFGKKDIYLDIYIEEKAKNNFNFFLINNIKELKTASDYLEEWTTLNVTNIYYFILYDNAYCKDAMTSNKGYLILKLKYIPDIHIITSYFKSLCRNVKWNNDEKKWIIPLFYIFEMTKLTLFLGGTVSNRILYYLCKLFNHFSTVENIDPEAPEKEKEKEQKMEKEDKGEAKEDKGEAKEDRGEAKEDKDETKEDKNETKKEKDKVTEVGVIKGTPMEAEKVANEKSIERDKTTGVEVAEDEKKKEKKCDRKNKGEETYNFETFLRNNKEQFVSFLQNTNIFRFEHMIIVNESKSEHINVKVIPYKEDINEKRKTHNFFFWNTTEHMWVVKKKNFSLFYCHIIKGFDFKLCSQYDYYKFVKQKLKSSDSLASGVNHINGIKNEMKGKMGKKKTKRMLSESIKENKKIKYNYDSSDSCASNEISNNVDSSYYEGRELVNKIKIIGAGNNCYAEIIYNKLNKLKYLKPPNYTYDPKGVITQDGAGTKGIQIFDLPSDIYEWNRISFCVVPDDESKVDIYDPKILCSLVSDVYLLKEKAIDIVLKKYKRWPEYTDAFWNNICAENEFVVCNKNFNTRQKLAHDRLFHKQFFYIFQVERIKQSNYCDALFLCKTLIILGEGKIMNDPLEAEYIIIENPQEESAFEFYNSLISQKKKKLPLFVTPKYIYDCILNYCIAYPSKKKKHVAFA